MVEDSGPGIPKEKHGVLFVKFQDGLDLLNQGTGIGFSLSRTLIDLMEGDIWLAVDYDSGIDNHPGACFVIDLKRPPVPIDHLTLQDHAVPTAKEKYSSTEAEVELYGRPRPRSRVTSQQVCASGRRYSCLQKARQALTPEDLSHVDYCGSNKWRNGIAYDRIQRYDLLFMDQYMASVDKQLLGTETVREMRSRGVTSVICGLPASRGRWFLDQTGLLQQKLSELLSSRSKLHI